MEKDCIYKEVKVPNNNKNEIAMKYKLSDTTIENIMREISLHFYIPKLEDFKKSNMIMYSPKIQKFISEFIKNNDEPFSSKDVIKAVRKDFGISLESHHLIKYMKENMNLSFKKGTSRPSNLKRERQLVFKWLFCIRIAKWISDKMILISIDETSFSRNIKVHYSWIQKGDNRWLNNTKFSNSLSTMAGIWLDGLSYNLLIDGTINSEWYLEYLQKLVLFLLDVIWVELSCCIMMYNWPVHRSRNVMDFIKKKNLKVHYLVPSVRSSLQYRNVFSDLKRLVCKRWIEPQMNLRSQKAWDYQEKSIMEID